MSQTFEYSTGPRKQPGQRSRAFYFASRIGFFFLGLWLVSLLVGFWTGFAPIFIVPALGLAILLLGLLALHLRLLQKRRTMLIMMHLGAAIRLRMPLPPYLRAAADSEPRAIRKRLRRLASAIEEGYYLGTAMDVATRGADPRTLGILNAAQTTGDLDQAVSRLTDADARANVASPGSSALLIYMLTLCVSTFVIFVMLTIFVFPKLVQICRDFKVTVPPLTQFLYDLPEWVPIVLISLLGLVALIAIGRLTRSLFTSRSGAWIKTSTDPFLWFTPGFGALIRQKDLYDFTSLLADGLAAGRTLPDAITAADAVHLNTLLRWRIHRFIHDVRKGAEPATAARDARMPNLLVVLLRSTDLVTAMRFAASCYAVRRDRLAILLRSVLPLLMAVVFGVFATALALSFFQPMVSLVEPMMNMRFRP